MKKIALSQTLAVLANMGVIAGIILLVFELRQTNDAIRGATYQAHSDSVENWDKFLADSEFLPDTILRYRESEFEGLSREDQFRLYELALASFNRLDGLFYQYERGLLDEDYYRGMFSAELEINVPRWRDSGLLESQFYKSAVRPTFREEIEKFLDSALVR